MKNFTLKLKNVVVYLIVLSCFTVLYSCGTPRPFYESGSATKPDTVKTKKVDYSIFFIGDTGDPVLNGTDYTLSALENQLKQAGDSSTVLFLGDNIYHAGLAPDTTYAARKEDEAIINRNLRTLTNYNGRAFFLPGNHDWRHGLEGVVAQERLIESFPTADAEFVPSDGCPGPRGFDLSEKWYLLIVDSQWMITESYKPNPQVEDCEFQTRTDVINQTARLAEEHSDKHVLIATHHPFFSNGSHGGKYPFRDHIFPLTNLVENLYVPLPLIGSIYPLYRKLGRSSQDLNHQQYEEFTYQMREAVENIENVFFAGGHEHSLSFYQKEKPDENKNGTDYFILSGAGSKTSYARTGYGAEFVYSHQGFAKLISYEDGSVNIEFWVPDKENEAGNGKLVYFKEIFAPEAERTVEEKIAYRRDDYAGTEDTVKIVQAGPDYAAGPVHRFIWGDHYRDAWTAEVDVPVFDMDTKKGGLEVLDVTGGEQTMTIIVQDSSENRYVMRSVQKNPAKSLPSLLQETFVRGVAQDQTSASHPYGVVIVPPLAAAAGVYHTNPEIGYLSKKSGIRMDIGDREGVLMNFEEFVSPEWFNKKYDKQAVDMISSNTLWERLRVDGRAKVDEKQLVRSRIFDMFIGDWDRHEGQWFWAETETDSLSIFEPIPIDRDNAFFKSDGVIPWIGRREWALRKFQLFDEGIRDMAGMNFNGRYFDRWFITELPREEWMAIARDMQQSLTDSVIENAINRWPEPIQELNGEAFTRKLKARRDKLTEFADRYYSILNEEVNVYGTDNPDLFDVERQSNGRVRVRVYELMSKDNKEQILRYERTFTHDVTAEIRLFGFAHDDTFNMDGNVEESVVLRIIGGEGQDIINDQSIVEGGSEATQVYDTYYGSIVNSSGETQSKQSDDPRINRFNERGFEYGFTAPLITAGYNRKDGVFLGGGTLITTHGFRKEPFATQHRITAKRALRTSSYSFNYEGIFTDELDPFNLEISAELLVPRFVSNFFGLGNESDRTNPDYDFYDYESDNVDLDVKIAEGLEELVFFDAGLGYEYYKPLKTGKFISSPQSKLTDEDFGAHHFATASGGLRVTTVDNPVIPNYGVEFTADIELNVGLNERSETFTRIASIGKVYYTLEDLNTTLASRVGFATNIGSYDFFQANMLGGQRVFTKPGNLRGFARNRFAGRTSLFHNTELRTRLGNLDSYFLPAEFGVKAFIDEGRVWVNDENSRLWHLGYGGGFWISPFEYFVLDATYAMSDEDEFISVTLGFNF